MKRLSIVILLAAGAVAHAAAPDYAREQRWAEEIEPAILVGEALRLSLPDGRRFLAIHEAPKAAKAAVIVVHGSGVHPDWGLINTLRSRLPEAGYATLSVQMPVLAADARAESYPPTFPEAAQRLAAAVAFLRGKGHGRIGIVSHSMGARMSNHYLVTTANHGIAAWAALGLGGGLLKDADRLTMPVLDLYGERDFPAVLQHADARARAIGRIKGSAQVQVAGADHFYADREAEMVRFVRTFLDRALAP